MIYFIPKCDGSFVEEKFHFFAFGKYKLTDLKDKENLIVIKEQEEIKAINIYQVVYKNCESKHIKKCFVNGDIYLFFDAQSSEENESVVLNIFSHEIRLILGQKIKLYLDNECRCETKNFHLQYSHIEYYGKIALIFFISKRNFIIAIQDKEVIYFDYYDEINMNEKSCSVMTKKFDSLNHGCVLNVEKDKVEKYLVYLDEYEMRLKEEFCSCVFLDCARSENYKYSNQLLVESLRLEQESEIKDFLQDFDDFYPIDRKNVILTKKDVPQDILSFEIVNNNISNIQSKDLFDSSCCH